METLLMKHIFIVDDDIHIGNMLEDALQREGYKNYLTIPFLPLPLKNPTWKNSA